MKAISHSAMLLLYNAVESGTVALICFSAGYTLSVLLKDNQTQLDSLWCMLSGLVVLQWLTKDAIDKAKELIIGSLTGCVVSAVICYSVGYHYISIFLSVVVSVLVIGWFNYHKAIITSSVTAAGMVGIGIVNDASLPQINSIMRTTDTIVGVILAIVVVFLSSKFKIRK